MQSQPLKKEIMIGLFSAEIQRAIDADNNKERLQRKQGVQPLSLDEYSSACAEMLGDNFLSEGLLQYWLNYIFDNSKLKVHFPAGYKCCLAAIPFSMYGNEMDQEEINNGAFLHLLLLDSDGRTFRGFSNKASYVADLLPKEVRQAAFTIPTYQGDGFSGSQDDCKRLMTEFENAYRQLQALLMPPPSRDSLPQ